MNQHTQYSLNIYYIYYTYYIYINTVCMYIINMFNIYI